MTYSHNTANLKASVMRRFMDDHSDQSSEAVPLTQVCLTDLYQEIRQNLEWILNTRVKVPLPQSSYHHASSSLLAYGVDDYLHYQFNSQRSLEPFCRDLALTITQFEPRLSDVSVTMNSEDISVDRTVYLKIEATIKLKPQPIAAVFESKIDKVNQSINVSVG